MRYKSRPVPEDLNTIDGRSLLREVMEALERITEGPSDAQTNDNPITDTDTDGGLATPRGLAPLGASKAGSFFTPLTTGGTITYIPPEPRNTIRSFTFPVGTTVTSGGNLKLSSDFVSTMPTDTLTLQSDGDIWFELARSLFSTALPPGTLDGQSLRWNGSNWEPDSLFLLFSTLAQAKTRFSVVFDDDDCFTVENTSGDVILRVDTNNGIVYCSEGNFVCNSRALLQGGLAITRTAVTTTPYNVSTLDVHLSVNTNAAKAIVLPTAASFGAGVARVLTIKDAIGAGCNVNPITLVVNGADTIDQVAANYVMNAVARMSITLLGDGTSNWEIW